MNPRTPTFPPARRRPLPTLSPSSPLPPPPLHSDAMTTILAIANQKGGVGKTTTAINLGAALGALERTSPARRLRPPGQRHPRPGRHRHSPNLYHALTAAAPAAEAVRPSGFPNLDLLPADRDLVGVEVEFVGLDGWQRRLAEVIAGIAGRYDTVLLDCPPSLGHMTVSALTAAHGVLVPLQCEYFALEGVSELIETVGRVRSALNPGLRIAGRRADHVRRPHQPLPRRRRRDPPPLHRQGLRHRGARATSASPRRPATACRSSSTTSAAAERRPISPSPASSCGGRRDHQRPATRARSRSRRPDRRDAGRRGDGAAVPIADLHPNRYQPRARFDDAGLEELAESIRVQGVIQPLVVAVRDGGGYTIVAGERRWRAAQRAGLAAVPAVVREVAGDRDLLEVALVENLQRADLNPVEEAEAYQALREKFGLSQEEVAARVGKTRDDGGQRPPAAQAAGGGRRPPPRRPAHRRPSPAAAGHRGRGGPGTARPSGGARRPHRPRPRARRRRRRQEARGAPPARSRSTPRRPKRASPAACRRGSRSAGAAAAARSRSTFTPRRS